MRPADIYLTSFFLTLATLALFPLFELTLILPSWRFWRTFLRRIPPQSVFIIYSRAQTPVFERSFDSLKGSAVSFIRSPGALHRADNRTSTRVVAGITGFSSWNVSPTRAEPLAAFLTLIKAAPAPMFAHSRLSTNQVTTWLKEWIPQWEWGRWRPITFRNTGFSDNIPKVLTQLLKTKGTIFNLTSVEQGPLQFF